VKKLNKNKKSVLGIIPARGGSKGVLRKNIRNVAGAPLISYTLKAALNCSCLSRVIVSTDDLEIASVARMNGGEVMMRPEEFARDDTPMIPVITHVLSSLAQNNEVYDIVVLLQPTTPLRSSEDIDAAVDLLDKSEADSVVSAYRVEDNHPSRMYKISDGYFRPYDKEPEGNLRQDLPDVFHRNGAIYASRYSQLVENKSILGDKILPYIMPRERSVNIDDEFDLKIADFLLNRKKNTEC
jgi:CMP-N,N'-diacetyllegionaminic acid synthase